MVPLGILLGRIRLLGWLFEPVIDMLATLPPPAVVPLVMLFAGTGDAAKVTMIAFAAGVDAPNRIAAASASRPPRFTSPSLKAAIRGIWRDR